MTAHFHLGPFCFPIKSRHAVVYHLGGLFQPLIIMDALSGLGGGLLGFHKSSLGRWASQARVIGHNPFTKPAASLARLTFGNGTEFRTDLARPLISPGHSPVHICLLFTAVPRIS